MKITKIDIMATLVIMAIFATLTILAVDAMDKEAAMQERKVAAHLAQR